MVKIVTGQDLRVARCTQKYRSRLGALRVALAARGYLYRTDPCRAPGLGLGRFFSIVFHVLVGGHPNIDILSTGVPIDRANKASLESLESLAITAVLGSH